MVNEVNPIISAISPVLTERVFLLGESHVRDLIGRVAVVTRQTNAPQARVPGEDVYVENTRFKAVEVAPGVVCINVSGILTKLPSIEDWIDDYFGLCPCYSVMQSLFQAANDASVEAIVLDIDSPGGFVNGSFELADAVAKVNQSKPVYAVVRGMCCSGAYLIASQCERIIARRESMVGNIGAYSVLMDQAKFWEELGITFTLVASGRFKGLGADGKVTDDLKAETQTMIDGTHVQFVAAVVSGRGMDEALVKTLADGRTYLGSDAEKLKLTDGTASSFEEALSLLTPPAAADAAEGIAMPKGKATPNAAANAASGTAPVKADKQDGDGEGAPDKGNDAKQKLHDAMSGAIKASDKLKDASREALDAHVAYQGEPEDDTKTLAKQMVTSMKAAMDEGQRCSDAYVDGIAGGDDGDDDEPDGDPDDNNKKNGGIDAAATASPAIFGKADFVKAFGEEKGLIYFGKDLSFADAQATFNADLTASHKAKCDAYEAQISALKTENEQLKTKLGAVDRGNEAASFAVDAQKDARGDTGRPEGGEKRFGSMSPGLQRYASSIKIPTSNN